MNGFFYRPVSEVNSITLPPFSNMDDIRNKIDDVAKNVDFRKRYKPTFGVSKIRNNEAIINSQARDQGHLSEEDDGFVVYVLLMPVRDPRPEDLFMVHGQGLRTGPRRTRQSRSTPSSPRKASCDPGPGQRRSRSATDPLVRSPELPSCHLQYSTTTTTRRLRCEHSR